MQACEDMYEQMSVMQKCSDPHENRLVSMSVNEARSIVRKEDYVIITLTSRITDVEGLGLSIEGKGVFYDRVVFDNYDDRSVTVRAYPDEGLMRIIADTPDRDIKVVFDMKWLIRLTQKCFETHGDRIGYPVRTPHFEPSEYHFPGGEPNERQREAVDTVLNSKLSYIWGAPGTGKTQFVIATAAIAHLRRGEKVIIVAPTNNAVEQALRGVMKVIEKDDPDHGYIDPKRDILRLGSPTEEFLREFKDICTDRSRAAKIERLRHTYDLIGDIFFERRVERAKAEFDEIRYLYDFEYDRADAAHREVMDDEIRIHWKCVCQVLRMKREFAYLTENVDEYNLRSRIGEIAARVFERERYPLEIDEYKDLDEVELATVRMECEDQLEELSQYDDNARVKSAKLLAMTPFTLMGKADSLFGEDGVTDAGHVFIDEVGYANLLQMLPVFMIGAPVAMLGDHMQLPPVCEVDFEKIRTWAETGGYMEYSFLWDTSARYTESALFGSIRDLRDDYLQGREPRFRETRQVDLVRSHRFADNLASILDECVYRNGITGSTGAPLEIVCYDVAGPTGRSRENLAEAEFVRDLLDSIGDDFAVLTPYRDQVKLLLKVCQERYGDRFERNILTVHSSQGREWDTVILSVSDNSSSDREVPYRFTSTVDGNQGLKVINTAVSRAKRRLIIVCDYGFWKGRAELGDLIGRLVADEDTVVL